MPVRAVDAIRASADADRARASADREARQVEARQEADARQATTLREQVRRSSTVTGVVVDESA